MSRHDPRARASALSDAVTNGRAAPARGRGRGRDPSVRRPLTFLDRRDRQLRKEMGGRLALEVLLPGTLGNTPSTTFGTYLTTFAGTSALLNARISISCSCGVLSTPEGTAFPVRRTSSRGARVSCQTCLVRNALRSS